MSENHSDRDSITTKSNVIHPLISSGIFYTEDKCPGVSVPQFVVCCFPAVAGGGLISNLGTFVLITSLHCLRQPREHYQVTLRKRLVSSWKIPGLPPPHSSLPRYIATYISQRFSYAGCEEGWWVVVVVMTPEVFPLFRNLIWISISDQLSDWQICRVINKTENCQRQSIKSRTFSPSAF